MERRNFKCPWCNDSGTINYDDGKSELDFLVCFYCKGISCFNENKLLVKSDSEAYRKRFGVEEFNRMTQYVNDVNSKTKNKEIRASNANNT